jgi:hypothetical protein
MKPEAFLKHTKNLEKSMIDIRSLGVAVGITKQQATSQVYDNGQSVAEVGARHEYGIGLPRRSFLRATFVEKSREVKKLQNKILERITDGSYDAKSGLALLGIGLSNFVKEAFNNEGFGQWQELSERTKKAKGSAKILTNFGVLKSSIDFEIRRFKK